MTDDSHLLFRPHQLPVGAKIAWSLGELHLVVEQRRAGLSIERHYDSVEHSERWTHHASPPQHHDPGLPVGLLVAGVEPEESFTLRPRLADRPLVARPEFDVVVSPGAELEVFLTSPLWIEVSARNQCLAEFPTREPAKTWFGEDTTRGILAYATRTRVRTTPAELSESRARVTTRAVILNHWQTPVYLSRAAIPLPSMKLYVDEDERCWSDSISITCSGSNDASVRVLSPSGEEQSRAQFIVGARSPARSDGLIEAFSSILTNPFAYVG